METTFSIFKNLLPKSNLPSFSTLLFQDGGNIVGVFQNFLFKAEAVSIEQIAVLVGFRRKKCKFKSMSCFAVVEFEDMWRFLVEYGWIMKTSWKISSSCYRRVWWRNSSCLQRKISRHCWRHRNRKCWRFICALWRFYKLLHWRNHSGAFQ